MGKKPLRATDKRRNAQRTHGIRTPDTDESEQGEAAPLARLFNDRRKHLGKGKRAV